MSNVDGSGADRLSARMARGAAFLGSEVAVMGGAMSWVSERNLVAAISNAGGFGVIACGAMTPALLDAEIAATKALTARPFGVNLITMHPDLTVLIAVCGAHRVGHVVLAGGLPPKGSLEAIKDMGAKLICFAPTLALAKKLIRSGVDALVIEGMEAGGHIGPVSTSVLAQEMLPTIADAVPVFVAGGIGRGEAIAGYLDMGAAGVQLGTRFVCATESIAHPNFKRAFIRASARDAVASVQLDPRLPVIPVRALRNAGAELFTAKQREVAQRLDEAAVAMAEAQLEIEHYWAGALRRAVVDGDVEHGSVMAGQSVGMVTKEEPVADILATLMAEAAQALAARGMTDAKGGLPVLAFADATAWEAWLAAQPPGVPGLWLKLAKQGNPDSALTKSDAIDGALAHGWIDGQIDKWDDAWFLTRFTPRRPRSRWSAVNVTRAEALVAAGRMAPAGQAEVDAAKADGRWAVAYAPASRATVPDDLAAALAAEPAAAAFFATLTGANRYAILHRVDEAKRPSTRAARTAKFVAMCAAGETIYRWARYTLFARSEVEKVEHARDGNRLTRS